jgi:polysaccharide export outer membrane protein
MKLFRRSHFTRGAYEVVRISGVGVILSIAVAVSSLMAQQYEQYQARKDAERLKPNRFLFEETGEGKDLLQRYYQTMLLERGKAKAPQLAATEEEALLKQLTAGIALEGPVNPSQYLVGPYDLFSVNLWTEVSLSFSGFVTPEGTLIIPTVGEVYVAGHSLKDVKGIVTREVRKRYAKGDVSVTLVGPRSFVVKVAGVVKRPGAYILSAVERVDRAIYLANLPMTEEKETPLAPRRVDGGQIPPYYRDEDVKVEQTPSMRNIRLVRANGDTIEVDLIRFYSTGEAAYNPYLQDGDIVIVPSEDLEANSVSIQGAVRLAGRFEYHRNDSLTTMFKIANGLAAAADTGNAELVRLMPDGKSFEAIPLDVRKVLSGEMNLALQPNDRVFVRWRKNLREDYTVTIKGEVHHPGDYPISRYGTTLSEVIARAGGFTPEAAVAECKIIRKSNSDDPLEKNPDYQRLADMRLSGMDKEEREYYTFESAIRRNFVSVDFRRLFIDNDSTSDVTLRDGDLIMVPSRGRTVYVYGQVGNAGFVSFIPGSDYQYYIEKAGGYTEAADKGNVSIIKAGSKKWVTPGTVPVEEGDAIFVSRQPERDVAYYLALTRDILTVTTAAATIYFLIDQVRK